ncbi:DNA-directed RNA polymerase I subunit RPA43 [Danio rerio]|uniref:DNA-directed RNA polymerase I subunit RPA43 n=1 Tax=Danio rerio TaxID=7955 RepID=UPI00003BEE78|nr:DNA-directed RNA polymerase I subunit RPA43 [Danio rerio]AAT68101.1 twistnb-like [Danio rerio]|eukprot:NP_001007154.1 DNA-directed RNA polymerase I subunit RPA43 [Danio rerio]
MANWTQEDGAPTPVTNPSEVSQVSGGSVTGGPAVTSCLIPSFAEAVKLLKARYSCLVLDTHRRHISLPPVHLKKKKTGIQEQLNAELLKYSNSLDGVPVAYDNIKVVGQHGNIYDDQGFIHFNIEASFVIFRPKNGSRLMGVINKMGASHVGCLVHGCFNASVMKPNALTSDQWRDSGLCVGQSLEFEVFQLDADAAGVLLIRGRLDRSRVQELVAQFEQKQVTAESSTEADATEDTTGSPKPKKKKKRKKDKNDTESSMEECVNNSSLQETSEHHQTTTEEDCSANGRHKEKKKKKKKRDKNDTESSMDECMNNNSLQETALDTTEEDCNANERHKEKKKKRDKQQDSAEIVPTSDSSGYISDKTSRKRALEAGDDIETLAAKKKKKSK